MWSIVIPAHDEARLLGATLDALLQAAPALGAPAEVLVVDDASADATADIARERGVRVLRVEHRHIAATRNAGAHATTGAHLLFLDADTHVDATVLRAATAALDRGAVGGGATVRLGGALSWPERFAARFFGWAFRAARIAPGCFIYCRRDAFDAIGGFDERWYAGEDVAISRALARQGRFVILRETVITSERKLRSFGWGEQLGLLWRLLVRGRGLLRSREHLDLWYGKRRD